MDYYSAGCVIYFSVTEKDPPNNVEFDQKGWPLISMSIDYYLDNLIARLMNKDPSKRPIPKDWTSLATGSKIHKIKSKLILTEVTFL